MYKVSVMYPNGEGATFDMDYYRNTHMKLVREHLAEFGLIRTSVERGISGEAGAPAPYLCVGMLYFDSPHAFDKGIEAKGHILRPDIPNFTNTTPIRLISEVLE